MSVGLISLDIVTTYKIIIVDETVPYGHEKPYRYNNRGVDRDISV